MPKIKLTKGELKRQRDSLAQFRHYLPTLQLKKQQLQIKMIEYRKLLFEKQQSLKEMEAGIGEWVGLLADSGADIKEWLIPQEVHKEPFNIAGANVEIFKGVDFKPVNFDMYLTPFWVDKGLAQLRKWAELLVEIRTIEEILNVLSRELRVTTQRVNLFEKVKIPECLENIRKIGIYLGDQMANAVGIGKVAKKKIEQYVAQAM